MGDEFLARINGDRAVRDLEDDLHPDVQRARRALMWGLEREDADYWERREPTPAPQLDDALAAPLPSGWWILPALCFVLGLASGLAVAVVIVQRGLGA